MASRTVFDPTTALRLTPLVTSSFALWHSWDQFFYLVHFTVPETRQKSNELLPAYFAKFFPKGAGIVVGNFAVTICAAIANLRSNQLPPAAAGWFKLGLWITAAHFLFVPLVSGPVLAIIEDRSK
jgi:hypothetical protein